MLKINLSCYPQVNHTVRTVAITVQHAFHGISLGQQVYLQLKKALVNYTGHPKYVPFFLLHYISLPGILFMSHS